MIEISGGTWPEVQQHSNLTNTPDHGTDDDDWEFILWPEHYPFAVSPHVCKTSADC